MFFFSVNFVRMLLGDSRWYTGTTATDQLQLSTLVTGSRVSNVERGTSHNPPLEASLITGRPFLVLTVVVLQAFYKKHGRMG